MCFVFVHYGFSLVCVGRLGLGLLPDPTSIVWSVFGNTYPTYVVGRVARCATQGQCYFLRHTGQLPTL